MPTAWISPWWQAALLPDVWDVCGVFVPSLTVWHTLALESIGCHYLVGGPCDRDDAASLLLFAGRDYREGRRLMLAQHYRARAMRRMFRKLRRVEWLNLHAACLEYAETCLRSPRRWEREGKGGKAAAVPYQWHLLAYLTAGRADGIEAAWNTPYATAICLFDAAAEAKGDDTLMAPEHERLDDELSEEKALILAGTGETVTA